MQRLLITAAEFAQVLRQSSVDTMDLQLDVRGGPSVFLHMETQN